MNSSIVPAARPRSDRQAEPHADRGSLSAPSPAASFLGPHHLVHRPDTPEGFLLDAMPPGRHRFGFSAQMPQRHPLFSDSTAPYHDLLYPMEALRQTAVFAAGRYFRVPEDRRVLPSEYSLTITALAPWRRASHTVQLTLDLDVTPVGMAKGVPIAIDCRASIDIAGRACGTARARLAFLKPDVRRSHRADDRPQDAGSPHPAPERVGRRTARNVLIGLPPEGNGESLEFPVDVAAAQEVLPGSGQPEVPCALFFEVSRQAALFSAGELYGLVPGHVVLTDWRSAFRGFAEPGIPLRCRVRPRTTDGTPGEVGRDRAGRPVGELDLTFTQDSRVVATMTTSLLQIC